MKWIRNLPTLYIGLTLLRPLRPLRKRIDRYREEGNYEKEAEQICLAEQIWGNGVCERIGMDLHVSGLEHIPEGPVVFAANHQGYCDIPAIAAAIPGHGIAQPIGFMAKKELSQLPLYGDWIRRVRSCFIDRADARASLRAIDEGISNLKLGFSMGIFPEGTRSRSDTPGEFKKGSLRLATKPGVPVVPVAISGTWKLYEAEGCLRPGRVDVRIHPAIETKDMDRKQANELPAVVEGIIRATLEELKSEHELIYKEKGEKNGIK